MNWKQHLFYGVVVSAALIVLTRPLQWFNVSSIKDAVQLFLITGVSPLILDLNHPMGKLHHVFLEVGAAVLAVGVIDVFAIPISGVNGMRVLLAGSIIILATLLIGYAFPHRGIWHSVPVCVAYGVAVWYFTGQSLDLGVLGFVGCYSHLVLDNEPTKFY